MNRTQFMEKWGDVIKGAPKKALTEIYKKVTTNNISALEAYKIVIKNMSFKETLSFYKKEQRRFREIFKTEEKSIEFLDDLKLLAIQEVISLT